VTLGWLRKLLGLPDGFEGVIYDTASVSTLHALAAALLCVTGFIASERDVKIAYNEPRPPSTRCRSMATLPEPMDVSTRRLSPLGVKRAVPGPSIC